MGVVTAATECLVVAEMRQGQDNWGVNKYWDLEQAKREHCELADTGSGAWVQASDGLGAA